jgi:hypothetical protein
MFVHPKGGQMAKIASANTWFRGLSLVALVLLMGCREETPAKAAPKVISEVVSKVIPPGPDDMMVGQVVGNDGLNNGLYTITMAGFTEDVGSEIKRGETFVASGWRGVPDGTIIYPIRIKFALRRAGAEPSGSIENDPNVQKLSFDYYFWKDPFGDWAYRMK